MKPGEPKKGMEEFLFDHRQRCDKMHALLFPPLDCPRGGGKVPHGMPDRIQSLVVLDAVNLEETQEETILATTGDEGEEVPPINQLRAKLKRLYGKESNRRRQKHGSVNLLEDGDEDDQGEVDGEEDERGEETVDQGEYCEGDDGRNYWAGPDENGISFLYVAVGSGKSILEEAG